MARAGFPQDARAKTNAAARKAGAAQDEETENARGTRNAGAARSETTRCWTWIARSSVLVVFLLNVSCAIAFIVQPMGSAAAYGLSATEENGALVTGLGVAFLMWNATYPLVILNPVRHQTLYGVVLAQQLTGLIGESLILLRLCESGLADGLMAHGIIRFIAFDGGGLVLMLAAFLLLRRALAMESQSR